MFSLIKFHILASNTSGAVIGYRSDQWLLRETKEYLNIQNVTEETKSDTETRNAVPGKLNKILNKCMKTLTDCFLF